MITRITDMRGGFKDQDHQATAVGCSSQGAGHIVAAPLQAAQLVSFRVYTRSPDNEARVYFCVLSGNKVL